MNSCNFLSLKEYEWSPKNISAIKYEYKSGEVSDYLHFYRSSCLIHYISDENSVRRYTLNDGTSFEANYGDIIFIPQKSKYYTEVYSVTKDICVGYCISFIAENAKFTDNNPQIIAHTESVLFTDCLNELTNIYLMHSDDTFAKKSAFYKLLSAIEKLCSYDEIPQNIKSAFDFIDAHITEKISLSHLADICYLSESQFRRLFKKYSKGISPKNYILRKKLEYARNYMSSSEITVEALAEMLGFYDASALCNAYKKEYGESISKQIKNII